MSAEATTRERGQVLIIVAVGLIFFLGIVGLVIDVGAAYSENRWQRSVTDSASLAGVQDLQRAGTRAVGAPEYTTARTHAMQSVVNQLNEGEPLPSCPVGGDPPYGADIVNCALPGTDYYVSVLVPAPTCITLGGCDPDRSVQVTVRQPEFGLVFARLFDQFSWNVHSTSVAELTYTAAYNMVTLRPPKPSRANDPRCAPDCDQNEDNVALDGTNTRLSLTGDLGTNTNMTLTAGATVSMPSGRFVFRYDAYRNWGAPPPDKQLSSPIADPNYPIPSQTAGTPPAPFTSVADAEDVSGCDAEYAKVPTSYGLDPYSPDVVKCFNPGIYDFRLGTGSDFNSVRAVILKPGTYFFNRGLNVGSNVRLVGGYEANSPGVALIFPSGASCTPGCDFDAESAPLVALNAGTAHPTIDSGDPATAAEHWDGTLVEAPLDPPVMMSILVEKDARCVVGISEPPDCPRLNQLALPGGGSIYLAGIQYAASDQSTIKGGSGANGYVGQLITWTVQYTGGSNINLTHIGDEGPGTIRIAEPCSPREPCDNPEAIAALP